MQLAIAPQPIPLLVLAALLARWQHSARRFWGTWRDRARGVLRAVVVHLTNAVASAGADAIVALLDSGTACIIEVYAGTIPADADTAIGVQTKLATLTMSAASFAAAVNGVATAGAITSGTAIADGTASFARFLTQSGGTARLDVNLGTSGAAINFNTLAFTTGSTISITALTLTQPKA